MTSMTVSAARPLAGAVIVRSGLLAALGVALLLVVAGPWRPADAGGGERAAGGGGPARADGHAAGGAGPDLGSARPRLTRATGWRG